MLDYQLCLTNIQPDVICYLHQYLRQLFIFFTNYSLALIKEAKQWFIDVIFDIWQGYICSVVYKSEHFNRVIIGFVYIHKFKEVYNYVEVLNYLASALSLSKKEQEAHLLISDSKAFLINAWCTNFPYMP
jgi:hypothetical protein